MSPFADGRIDSARRRLAECIEDLRSAIARDASDGMLWFDLGGALEKARAAQHDLDAALMLEEAAMGMADTVPAPTTEEQR